MIIYKDIFSGDEIASDSFPTKLVDDFIFEFRGRHCVRKEGEITLDGANKSEEAEEDEGSEEAVERGIDLCLNHKLKSMDIYTDKKMFTSFIKEYVKKLTAKLEETKSADEVATFKTKIQAYVKSLIGKDRFKTLEFFTSDGESAADGQLVILEYRDVDGEEIPTIMILKDGTDVEKV